MKSENSMQVLDEHRFPFSLVNEHKHGQAKILTQQGDVTEQMDKVIGRSVFRIRGAVSANNYVEFEHLNLVGPIVYVQMCLQNPVIATFHLEVVTSANVSLRLSVSTLYDGDAPKFLGRSLRLPLPHLVGWMVIKLDLNEIIARYCSSGTSKSPTTLQAIKKIQMCSSMLFRDVVTSDKHIPFEARLLPKELAIKPQSGNDPELLWVDMIEHCSSLASAGSSAGGAANLKSPELNSKSAKSTRVQKTLLLAQDSPPPAVTIAFGQKVVAGKDNAEPSVKSVKPAGLAIKTNFTEGSDNTTSVTAAAATAGNAGTALFTMADLNDSVLAHSPMRPSLGAEGPSRTAAGGSKAETAMARNRARKAGSSEPTPSVDGQSASAAAVASSSPNRGRGASTHPMASPGVGEKETVLSQALSTPRHTLKSSNAFTTPATAAGAPSSSNSSLLGSAGIVRYQVPDVAPSDRLLSLERLLGYNGGPSVLLYDGRMLLLGTHSLLVMVDLQSDTSPTTPTNSGLWKAFRNAGSSVTTNAGGFRQAILRGHSAPITMIELSETENLMATAEAVGVDGGAGLLILWDLVEGKKLASLKPHSDTILCAGFSPDCAMLVTCGTDEQHRYQIIVWDLQTTLSEKSVVVGSQANSASFTIARQISEFPIFKIRFSPFEEYSLVSCGRENIRFWRIRKGHLPGRPVVLNEYSRGYSFTELAFNTEGGLTLKEGKKHVVYVASSKGLLLRINCQNNQILAAFQLHPGAILSLSVHSGYAATGGEDCRLRVWPLDFSDFLLEAQHEGPVTNIRVAHDGRRLAIGTSTGTLGVLHVSEHSYHTILRSHIGAITQAVKRGPLWHEFATIGRDFTIRVWDVLTATQIIEFSSERDEPLCLSYHPSDHYLACGFRSGHVRVFDVVTAGQLYASKSHTGAVTGLTYVTPPGGGLLLLVSAGADGNLVVHSEVEGYTPVKTVSFASALAATERVHLVLDEAQTLLAVATTTIASIVVFETKEFTTHVKLLPTIQSPAAAPPTTGLSAAASGTGGGVGGALGPSVLVATMQPSTTAHAVFSQLVGGSTATPRAGVPATPTAASGTVAAAATSGGSSTGADDSLSAVVVGLFFVNDESGGSLVITTDKHLISVPMQSRSSSRRVSRRSTPWDERCSRRMDFGVPTSVRRDDATGLVFMTVRAPVSAPKKAATKGAAASAGATGSVAASSKTLNKLAPEANAFVVLEVRVQQQGYSDANKVLVSPVQLYQDLPGVVLDVCPYIEFSRVVSVDVNGCIGFWEVKDHNLANVKIPEGNFKNSLMMSKASTAGAPSATSEISTPMIKNDGVPSAVEDATNEALDQFEQAVKHDPAMWSAVGDSAVKRPKSDSVDSTEPESESVVESSAIATGAAPVNQKESFESILARAVKYTGMPDLSLNPKPNANGVGTFDVMYLDDDDEEEAGALAQRVNQDRLLLEQFDDSMEEEQEETAPEKQQQQLLVLSAFSAAPAMAGLEEPAMTATKEKVLHKPKPSGVGASLDAGRTSTDALFGNDYSKGSTANSSSAVREFSLNHVLALAGPAVLAKLLPKVKLEDAAGGLLSSPQYDSVQGATLALRNAVPPRFNVDEGVLVNSDGSSIVVKYLHSSESILLKFPEYLHQFRTCSVVSTSLSHSGVVIAAVIRVVSNTDHSIAHCLIVWCSAAAGEWKVAGMADLSITETQQQIDFSALNKVLVDWSDNDSLVVISTVRSNTEVKSFAREQIRIVTAPMSAILSGGLKDAIKACSCVVNVPTCYVISNFKVLPSRGGAAGGSSGGAVDRKMSLIVTSQHKAFHLQLSNANTSGMIAEVIWSDDIGNRGPYLSLDIIKTQGEHMSTPSTASRKDSRSSVSRLIVALLDSFGAVKFVEFFQDEPTLTSRTVTVNIPASNISGALHSMALIPQAASSNLLVALGATHNIRVFSVQFKDVNVKTLSANMVLNFKVSVDFSPDFFFSLPNSHSHTHSSSSSSALAVPVPPLLAFSESGHVGLVTAAGGGGGASKDHHQCFTLQSAGPSTSDVVVAASFQSAHPLLSLVTHKGHLSLVHSCNGIKLASAAKVPGVGRLLCVEPAMGGGRLVVGASSGRVALLDALTLEVLETWPLQGATPVRSSVSSSTASFHKKLPGVSTSTDFDFKFHKNHAAGAASDAGESEVSAVVRLNALAGGMALIVLQRNNTVSIVQLYQTGKADVATVAPAFEHSGPNVITDRLSHREQTQTVLSSCAGDEQMCAVLRAGTNILELHRTDHNEVSSGSSPLPAGGVAYKKKSYWTNVLNLSLKTVGPEGPGNAREQRAGTHDVNIVVESCHVQFSGRELLLCVVGRDVHHSGSSVYCGAVSMPESASSTFTKDSPTRVLLTRQTTFAESVESHHFHKNVLAVALTKSVVAFELNHAAKDGVLRELLNVPASAVALGSSWENATVTVSSPAVCGESERVLVVSRQRPLPSVLSFRISL